MQFLKRKIIKETIRQISEIDSEIEQHRYIPNPVFRDFDENFMYENLETKKTINKIKDSIRYTKK